MENFQKSSGTSSGETTVTGEIGDIENSLEQTAPIENYAGWKTYTNGEIGYTLKYPVDWAVQETDEFSPLYGETVKYIAIYAPENKYFLHWGLKEKGAGYYISDRTGMGAGEERKSGKIKILGTEFDITNYIFQGKAKEIFYPTAGRSLTGDGKYEFTAALSGGSGSNWDNIDLSSAPEKALAEKILKSVALAGKTTSPADCEQNFTNEENLNKTGWKTFSNEKYGYYFEHPKSLTVGEKQDDYTGLGSGADQQSFEWRSGSMTGTDYYGYKEDRQINRKVGCANAKITYLSGDPTADPPGDVQDRLILVQFEKSGIPHVILFSYQYVGASISGDVAEMFELMLKTVAFR